MSSKNECLRAVRHEAATLRIDPERVGIADDRFSNRATIRVLVQGRLSASDAMELLERARDHAPLAIAVEIVDGLERLTPAPRSRLQTDEWIALVKRFAKTAADATIAEHRRYFGITDEALEALKPKGSA